MQLPHMQKINKLASKNILTTLILLLAAIELISTLSIFLANFSVPEYSKLGTSYLFAWLTVHHLFLFALTLLAMIAVFRMPLSEFGFNFCKWRTSLAIISIFTVVFFFLELSYMSGQTYTPDPNFPLTNINKLYWQGFQYFLSGLGEEPLFRGGVIALLLNALQSTKLKTNHQYIFVIVVSTLFFMFAHLSVDWMSLSVSGFDLGQQTKALQLGVLYAIVFIHTRSLFAPIVLHGLSNGITATIGFYIV